MITLETYFESLHAVDCCSGRDKRSSLVETSSAFSPTIYNIGENSRLTITPVLKTKERSA